MGPTESDRRTGSELPGSPCTIVLSSTESVPVHGRAEWMTSDRAYVVVPYGTARSVRQHWNAVAIVPDRKAPNRSRELRMKAELMSAETVICPESGTEGLLLRLSNLGDRLVSDLADMLPNS